MKNVLIHLLLHYNKKKLSFYTKSIQVHWTQKNYLSDFNGMSTCLDLSYAVRLGITFILRSYFQFLWSYFKRVFDIHTDHLISARRPDLIIINKKKRTFKIVDFAVPADHRIKLKECEKKDKELDLARELKKTMEHAGDNYTNCNWCVWNSNERITKRTGGLESWRTSGDHPIYYIIENGRNTEKSPGDLWRLAVSPVKNHLVTLLLKTLMCK